MSDIHLHSENILLKGAISTLQKKNIFWGYQPLLGRGLHPFKMDDYNVSVLLDAKTEYTKQLTNEATARRRLRLVPAQQKAPKRPQRVS